jgi:adenylosuccinate lyase
MAHVHAFGDAAPSARGIVHWGATSCYVTDNADLMLMREGLQMLRTKLLYALKALCRFAQTHRALPCLGYTHFQPAQPTTIGKRATLWAYDLVLDLQDIEYRLENLKARSVKGTTGTQASFLQIFHGDHAKVRQLEQMVAKRIGFHQSFAVTGQTYSRKIDAQILATLSGVAQSAHKAATDWRLLANRKELTEPHEAGQIGSSAMAYKRNPMRSERICALARFLISLESSASTTASTQWLERSLDDSANRRLVIPQAFLACDAILMLYANVAKGMTFHPKMADQNLRDELPFMATEQLLMRAVEAGCDRQEVHERIRQHSLAAAERIQNENLPNDLWQRFQSDPMLAGAASEPSPNPSDFVGRAPEQVDEFLNEVIAPIWEKYGEPGSSGDEVHV